VVRYGLQQESPVIAEHRWDHPERGPFVAHAWTLH
jgi:hypothetical protein